MQLQNEYVHELSNYFYDESCEEIEKFWHVKRVEPIDEHTVIIFIWTSNKNLINELLEQQLWFGPNVKG